MVITSKQQQNNIKLFIVPEAKTDAFDELVETLYDAGLPVFPAAYDADLDQLKPLTRVKDCRAYRPGRRLWESAECIAVRLDDLVLIDDDGYKDIPDERRLERRRVLRELTDGANPVQANEAKRSYHYLARIDDHEGLKHSADGYMGLKIDIKTGNQLMYIKPGKSLDLRALRRHKRLPEASEATIAALKSKRNVNRQTIDVSEFTEEHMQKAEHIVSWLVRNKEGHFAGASAGGDQGGRDNWLRLIGFVNCLAGTEWHERALNLLELVDDGNGDSYEKVEGERTADSFNDFLGMICELPEEERRRGLIACNDVDLMDEPKVSKRDPIIHGLMNHKSTFELVGESNIGKSFEMLSRMACVATGRDYASFPTHKAHCFYFDAEGGDDTEIRVKALQEQLEDPLEWLHIIDIQKERLDPTNDADMDQIISLISRAAGNDPVGLVAFDSLNQTMVNYKAGNFDENNSTDMGKVAKALKTIAETTGACAGVIHHPAKSKSGAALRTGRGSGALHGAVDIVYALEEAVDGLNHYVEKARGLSKALPFGLKKMVVKVDGVEVKETPTRNPHNAEKWGLVEIPATIAPSNETLFVVPIRLAVFESAAGKAGRRAVSPKYSDGVKNLSKLEMALVDALETLQTKEYRKQGYSGAEICKAADTSVGGDKYKALRSLIDSRDKVLIPGLDSKNRHNKYYRIPVGPNDYEDRETADDDYDLSDD